MYRRTSRLIRASLILALSLAAVVAVLAGLWPFVRPSHPGLLTTGPTSGLIWFYDDSHAWSLEFRLGSYGDTSFSFGGSRGRVDASFRYKVAAGAKEHQSHFYVGSLLLSYGCSNYSCSGPPTHLSNEQRVRWYAPSVYYMLDSPAWLPMPFFAAFPPWVFIRGPLRRRRRRTKGLCLVCAYDLTGNVSGVCPECGTTK